jgi:hypothetical protein
LQAAAQTNSRAKNQILLHLQDALATKKQQNIYRRLGRCFFPE